MSTARKIADLKEKTEKILLGGGHKRIEKQHQLGKLTARERIALLLDADSFVELDRFVVHRCHNFGMETTEAPGEGVITGYGTVDGRTVFVFAQDFTVLGGSQGEMGAKKICKVMDMAIKVGAPIIGLNDSGGARIQEGVDALSSNGQIFYRNTLASGVIPQISAIMGPCAGGAAYSPALTDFVFMVEGTSQMFVAGPQVIKAVTEEDVTAEQLGGAATHSQISGIAHFTAENDHECIQMIRLLLSYLPSNNNEMPPETVSDDDPARVIEELNYIIPDNHKKPYDMKEVIYQVVDDGEFFEVQPYYATNIVVGLARFDGKVAGIVANQPKILAGCIDVNGADKAARFIRFCDAFNIPLITFVDVPGFLPGISQEHGGIIRHGAKMLYAYSEAIVPKITVITRKAYGGAYLAMCGKDLGADQVFAWPTAEIAVMGPEGAANIIFKDDILQAEDPKAMREQKLEEYKEKFVNPYTAAARGLVDLIIEPRETRVRIIEALRILRTKQETRLTKKHGNIPL